MFNKLEIIPLGNNLKNYEPYKNLMNLNSLNNKSFYMPKHLKANVTKGKHFYLMTNTIKILTPNQKTHYYPLFFLKIKLKRIMSLFLILLMLKKRVLFLEKKKKNSIKEIFSYPLFLKEIYLEYILELQYGFL